MAAMFLTQTPQEELLQAHVFLQIIAALYILAFSALYTVHIKHLAAIKEMLFLH